MKRRTFMKSTGVVAASVAITPTILSHEKHSLPKGYFYITEDFYIDREPFPDHVKISEDDFFAHSSHILKNCETMRVRANICNDIKPVFESFFHGTSTLNSFHGVDEKGAFVSISYKCSNLPDFNKSIYKDGKCKISMNFYPDDNSVEDISKLIIYNQKIFNNPISINPHNAYTYEKLCDMFPKIPTWEYGYIDRMSINGYKCFVDKFYINPFEKEGDNLSFSCRLGPNPHGMFIYGKIYDDAEKKFEDHLRKLVNEYQKIRDFRLLYERV